jgi:hypothetical protein
MHADAAGAAAACTRARVVASVIDTMYQLQSADLQLARRRPGRELPELALLTVPNFREYFYTKNSILHARPKCTFASGWPNMPVLIQLRNKYLILVPTKFSTMVFF